jgi:hypothetical protein
MENGDRPGLVGCRAAAGCVDSYGSPERQWSSARHLLVHTQPPPSEMFRSCFSCAATPPGPDPEDLPGGRSQAWTPARGWRSCHSCLLPQESSLSATFDNIPWGGAAAPGVPPGPAPRPAFSCSWVAIRLSAEPSKPFAAPGR